MANPKSVLVIGGGISGLAAAEALARAGTQVTLLEAKGRLGGRIKTLHDHDFPIELGAEFLHGRSESFLTLVRKAELPLDAATAANRVLIEGRLQPVDLWQKAGEAFGRARPMEPDLSCAAFLQGLSLSTEEHRQLTELLQGFHAGPADRLSTHALLRADYSSQQMDGTQQSRIREGYGAIIKHLADNIRTAGGRIHLNAMVRRIDWQPGSVEISVQRGPDRQVLRADAAVIALPLGVLKATTVVFHPMIQEKQEAIEGLGVGAVVKVILLFKERWWTPEDIGLVHSYDEPIPTWWSNPRGPALIGWAGGPKAERISGWPPSKLESIALEVLGRLFDEKKAAMRSLFVQSFSHNWMADQTIRGAYSYIPVNGMELPKLLAAPLKETLFFAGEAAVTDAQTGMIFNAYGSGLRAAQELLECS
jgi:monoamine oxidase